MKLEPGDRVSLYSVRPAGPLQLGTIGASHSYIRNGSNRTFSIDRVIPGAYSVSLTRRAGNQFVTVAEQKQVIAASEETAKPTLEPAKAPKDKH